MVRKILSLFLSMGAICFFVSTSHAQQIEREHLDAFSKVIRQNGYACREANKGHFLENGARGMNFMVACDNSAYLYFVQLQHGSDSFCVEQYKNRGTKCEE